MPISLGTLSLTSSFLYFYAVEFSCKLHDDSLFDCRDGACLMPEAQCDGFVDCLNGTDELGCSKLETLTTGGRW